MAGHHAGVRPTGPRAWQRAGQGALRRRADGGGGASEPTAEGALREAE